MRPQYLFNNTVSELGKFVAPLWYFFGTATVIKDVRTVIFFIRIDQFYYLNHTEK